MYRFLKTDLCYIIFLHYIDIGLIRIYYFYVKHHQYDEHLMQQKGNHFHLICICSAVSLVTMYLNRQSLHIKSSDLYKRSNVPMYSIRFTIELMFIHL